jgi:hypothetical protein
MERRKLEVKLSGDRARQQNRQLHEEDVQRSTRERADQVHMKMLVEEWNRDDSLRLAEGERLAKAAETQARMRVTLDRASRLEVDAERRTRLRLKAGELQRQGHSREQQQYKADHRQEMVDKERSAAMKATEKRA